MARPQNSELSDEELVDKTYSDKDLSGEDLATHHLFWGERVYHLSMDSYHSELSAYERFTGREMIRTEDHDEEYCAVLGASDIRWARAVGGQGH